MTSRITNASILGIIGLVLCIGGFYLGHHLGKPILTLAKASAHWPSVEGKIEISEVISRRDTSQKHKHENKHSYRQHVEYSYVVENQPLRNKVVWFGDDYSSNSRSSHQAVVNRYPTGSAVKVYYDPTHPEVSVLEPGAKFTSYVMYVVGWTLVGFGVIFILGGFRTLVMPNL